MLLAIKKSGICKRLVFNTCNPKCCGYEFSLGDERLQKCKFNCFEFFISEENNPFIKIFVENELKERATT
jgi:hypothetical protein